MDNKELVRLAFRNVIEATSVDSGEIERYFSTQYVQEVDGKTLHFEEFVAHVKKQKETVASAKVDLIALISEGDVVFSNHEVNVLKKDGSRAKFKVIAQFLVRDGRIAACDELTRMIEGEKSDRDLGSRH